DRKVVHLVDRDYPPLGRGEYDAILFGVGFRECLLASLLIQRKKRVLIISKKQQFAWDNTSFDLLKLFSRFREEEPTDEDFEALGSNKAYHIDLIPKVIVAYGSMARLLREIGVYDSLELQPIDLHMAYSGRSKKIGRLPSSPEDASRSSVLSIMQRIRCRSLLQSVQEQCEEKSPEAGVAKLPLSNATMEDTYHKFTISEGTQAMIGHGLALYENDDYQEEEARATFDRIDAYMRSGGRPFLYPVGGKQSLCNVLQPLLQASELCDVMLKQTSKQLVFENNHICGVVVGDRAARAPVVVGDTTWFREDRQKKTGKAIRSICLLNHPVEGCEPGKSSVSSFFRKQLVKAGYKPHEADISVLCLPWTLKICPKGIYVAVIATTVETQKPEKELKPVLDVLGPVLERFDAVTTLYRVKKATKRQGIFIFTSPNASISLDGVADDIFEIADAITNPVLV
ncbi:hypothetical protein WA577_003589, partial [Blastocystis sp. JDR]